MTKSLSNQTTNKRTVNILNAEEKSEPKTGLFDIFPIQMDAK